MMTLIEKITMTITMMKRSYDGVTEMKGRDDDDDRDRIKAKETDGNDKKEGYR